MGRYIVHMLCRGLVVHMCVFLTSLFFSYIVCVAILEANVEISVFHLHVFDFSFFSAPLMRNMCQPDMLMIFGTCDPVYSSRCKLLGWS